jgi:hypothetical protein
MKVHQVYVGDATFFSEQVAPTFEEEMSSISKLPGVEYKLWKHKDILGLISKEYGQRGVAVYEKIRPNALKTDFVRAVILNTIGGLYLDIGCEVIDFTHIRDLSEDNHMILFSDIEEQSFVSFARYKNSIQNSVMYSKGKNIYLTNLIEEIMTNVENNFYGDSPWDAVSVVRFGKVFLKTEIDFNYILGKAVIFISGRKMFVSPVTNSPVAASKRLGKQEFFHSPENSYVTLWQQGKLYNT